jgi:hypothetical protein
MRELKPIPWMSNNEMRPAQSPAVSNQTQMSPSGDPNNAKNSLPEEFRLTMGCKSIPTTHSQQKQTCQSIAVSNQAQIQQFPVSNSKHNNDSETPQSNSGSKAIPETRSPNPVNGLQNQPNTHLQLGTKLTLPQYQAI